MLIDTWNGHNGSSSTKTLAKNAHRQCIRNAKGKFIDGVEGKPRHSIYMIASD